MLQRYHLALRQPHSDHLRADRRSFGWLLPIVAADARELAPHVISRLIERLNVQGTLACVTSGIVDKQAAGIDWLAVVDEGSSARPPTLRETSVTDLLESPALLPVQSALLRAYRRLSETTQSALSPGWLTNTTNWARRFLPDDGSNGGVTLNPHRAELFEAVWEFRQPNTSLYLTWRGHGPLLDPDVAHIVATHGRARVPETVACDRANGLWLTESVRGRPLTAQLSPAAIGRVAQAMARVHVNLAPVAQRLRSSGVSEESLAYLAAEGDRILDWLAHRSDHPDLRGGRAAIHRACAELDALRIPATWIHTDFVPENVFVDDDTVSFIDFDGPWIGPAPVAMEFMYSGLRRHMPDMAERSAALTIGRDSFARAWRALVPTDVMCEAFGWTRLVAEVLRISRRLRSIEAKEKREEVTGLFEPAARESARRLAALASLDYLASVRPPNTLRRTFRNCN